MWFNIRKPTNINTDKLKKQKSYSYSNKFWNTFAKIQQSFLYKTLYKNFKYYETF